MDVNSKINWSPGMEITAKTLIGLEEKLDFQRRVAIRAALGNTRMGMVPGSILSCNGSFFKNTFEIEHLQCVKEIISSKFSFMPLAGELCNAIDKLTVSVA